MKVKQGKATATLTDVKNLIGDVFAAVDKYGEVTITSYNKPKYLITKYKKEAQKEETEQKVEEKKPEPKPVAPEPKKVEPKPEPKIEHKKEEPTKPMPASPASPAASNAPAPTPAVVEEIKETVKADTSMEVVDGWDRSNDKEQVWVQKSRNLI